MIECIVECMKWPALIAIIAIVVISAGVTALVTSDRVDAPLPAATDLRGALVNQELQRLRNRLERIEKRLEIPNE